MDIPLNRECPHPFQSFLCGFKLIEREIAEFRFLAHYQTEKEIVYLWLVGIIVSVFIHRRAFGGIPRPRPDRIEELTNNERVFFLFLRVEPYVSLILF
jgi:hypothetical protein